ncbi:hypothetical protein BV20DRAFT_461991 [Pilatotrama ljubarskyi]|nr:hypothetical protein BV20DRAFT_461991 [Pilatotrama ljubarskyi]
MLCQCLGCILAHNCGCEVHTRRCRSKRSNRPLSPSLTGAPILCLFRHTLQHIESLISVLLRFWNQRCCDPGADCEIPGCMDKPLLSSVLLSGSHLVVQNPEAMR